jgi:hypothetical protein
MPTLSENADRSRRVFLWLSFCVVIVVGLHWFGPRSHAADYVVNISVDGLRPDYLQARIDAGSAPNFKRFQDEGAWTHNARTDYTHSNTLPNHTSMVTGRPVLLPAGLPAQTEHGYTQNDDPPASETLHNLTTPDWYKASTFDVVHDAGYTTALYASKFKFIIYEQSYNAANGAPHANGSDKINTFYGPESTASMQSQMLSQLPANDFKYTFLHYADLDDAGHSAGWGSAAYNTAIATVDTYLGQLFNAIENDPQLAGRTAIVLSADHGGTGTGHSDATNVLNYTIPFYVWGAGVGHGDLYSFNTDSRTNPGTSRPTYTASGQPIRNGDGGNLALTLLGLESIPGSLINGSQNLRVTTPGDFNADNKVDAADYVDWRNGAGAYTPDNYDTWRSNFGSTAGSGAGLDPGHAPVPEPATVSLAAALVFSFIALRRPFAVSIGGR